jgi:hypothetical protein
MLPRHADFRGNFSPVRIKILFAIGLTHPNLLAREGWSGPFGRWIHTAV